MEKIKITEYNNYYLLNDQYAVYKDTGRVYNMESETKTPEYVFEWRDKHINEPRLNEWK